jgi:hypothetical protein
MNQIAKTQKSNDQEISLGNHQTAKYRPFPWSTCAISMEAPVPCKWKHLRHFHGSTCAIYMEHLCHLHGSTCAIYMEHLCHVHGSTCAIYMGAPAPMYMEDHR